jgi:hypothetical protein
MRSLLLTLGIVFGLLFVPSLSVDGTSSAALAFTASASAADTLEPAQEAPKAQIDVNINKGGGGRAWYANPVWIAIGAVALVVLIMLVVMASKGGGGTTVVRG